MGKGLRGIDDELVEGQALAFMDGYGPRQAQRHLRETAYFGLLNVLVFSVDAVFHILPSELRNGDDFIIALHCNGIGACIVTHYLANLAVEKGLFGRRVIFDEHHLSTDFEFQNFFGRVGVFGKNTIYLSLENN